MDYEKKYKEALEKARQLCAYPTTKPFISDLQDLFPELKESEDERIRKDIISHFAKGIEGSSFDEVIEKYKIWIAWLEKQGKQKPVWNEEDSPYYDDICEILINLLRSETAIVNKTAVQKDLDWLNSLKDRVQPQLKQEWSEEDEKMLKDTIRFCELCGNKVSANWLKSIKDRVQPQNSIITDEELAQAKKDAYNNVLDKIEYDSENPTFDDGWSAAIWYLKKRNAQPQNTWKPSDEQLKQLGKYCPDNTALTALYEQLKKLKGE